MSEIKTNKISPRKGTTQTIGDSGDSVTIASGTTTTNAGTITTAGISGGTINNTTGTISGLAGVVEWDTTAKTTAFTAVSNKGYFCNTTSASFTVTLPASPTAGDVIGLKDYANTFDTNKLILDPNGNKIQGSTGTFQVTVEGANSQFIYVDATRGWVLTDASKASDIAEDIRFVTATGGTITTCGDYKIHTFTGPGTFCVSCAGNPAGNDKIDYMVVAGGAGGGGKRTTSFGGAGGGAGGYRESKVPCAPWTASPLATCASLTLSATGYPVTVGGGGTGGNGPAGYCSVTGLGFPGSNSVFSTITSTGGGGGGHGVDLAPLGFPGRSGLPGGSGGGGAGAISATDSGDGNTPPVSPSQGNRGGNSQDSPAYPGPDGGRVTGGGGGAISVGDVSSGFGFGAGGGPGAISSINGTPTARAGGGGGGNWGPGPAPAIAGGNGGGGNGGNNGGGGSAGSANTGGGGGGGSPSRTTVGGAGGDGGSGIVIIRYKYQ